MYYYRFQINCVSLQKNVALRVCCLLNGYICLFLSSGPGTGSTQPRGYNWGATWWKSSGSCLENREYGRRDPSRWPRGTLYPQKLAITSPTSEGRSVGIVRSRTQTMEFFFYLPFPSNNLFTVSTTPVLQLPCHCVFTSEFYRSVSCVSTEELNSSVLVSSTNSLIKKLKHAQLFVPSCSCIFLVLFAITFYSILLLLHSYFFLSFYFFPFCPHFVLFFFISFEDNYFNYWSNN
jgi:hypothetical protein